MQIGNNTHYQYKNGFHWACENGYTEKANLLLPRDDVDVNSKDKWVRREQIRTATAITLFQRRTGLLNACENGHTKIVTLLPTRDDVDVKKDTLIQSKYLWAEMMWMSIRRIL
mmetsp:Transcript_20081/g.25410  ORF Transcript_20081/g.25410 Transcript_20081/m.25410 type:complete len:113 (+) Transcript_20081:2206-2544(+)